MNEQAEITITSECAVFLRNELREIIKHCDTSTNTMLSLINLAEGLNDCDRVIITIVPEY